MSDWKIRRLRGECAKCERAFETDGERLLTQVRFADDELVREDFHPECWEEPSDAIYWWATRREVKGKNTLALDFELIERLFFQLEERKEDKIRELRYLLCLMLMRKRRLKLLKVQRGKDGEAMLVRRPRHNEEWRVFVYDFEPERLDALRGELATLLDGDFEEDGEGAELSSEDAGHDAGHDATHNHEVGLSGDEEPA
jgi:hypothetical protein